MTKGMRQAQSLPLMVFMLSSVGIILSLMFLACVPPLHFAYYFPMITKYFLTDGYYRKYTLVALLYIFL